MDITVRSPIWVKKEHSFEGSGKARDARSGIIFASAQLEVLKTLLHEVGHCKGDEIVVVRMGHVRLRKQVSLRDSARAIARAIVKSGMCVVLRRCEPVY